MTTSIQRPVLYLYFHAWLCSKPCRPARHDLYIQPPLSSYNCPSFFRWSSRSAIRPAAKGRAQHPMQGLKLRIPYKDPLPQPTIIPSVARTLPGAVSTLRTFLSTPPYRLPNSTVVLTGAGLSVASGLADYRGVKGTYRVNESYKPIFHHDFVHNHEPRKRYWARSFLGWSSLDKAAPNQGHFAIRDLADLGVIESVITQNVDSFHPRAHPQIPTVELHGYLRATVCTSCKSEFPRQEFQEHLARLNPRWAALLEEVLASGALTSEDPEHRKEKGLRTNPDGDVDLPEAPYTTFRYPPCPKCLAQPPVSAKGFQHVVQTDEDGAWAPPSTAGILKPAVVMFGESINADVKKRAEKAIDQAGKLLVLGTSLATYSAWRLVKRAKDRGMAIAIVNLGGVRGEAHFFKKIKPEQYGLQAVRVDLSLDELLPRLAAEMQQQPFSEARPTLEADNAGASTTFKDMMS